LSWYSSSSRHDRTRPTPPWQSERTIALQLLAAAIDVYPSQPPDKAAGLLRDCARLAFVLGKAGEVETTLTGAARAADREPDAGKREWLLAEIAALRHELIG
jgi:hypothetical protein